MLTWNIGNSLCVTDGNIFGIIILLRDLESWPIVTNEVTLDTKPEGTKIGPWDLNSIGTTDSNELGAFIINTLGTIEPILTGSYEKILEPTSEEIALLWDESKWIGIYDDKIIGLTVDPEVDNPYRVLLGVFDALMYDSSDSTTLSLEYGTLLYTSKVPLLGFIITNILGDIEWNPLG